MALVPPVEGRSALRVLGDLYADRHPFVPTRTTGFEALDRALGGGLRDGELALLAGPPGVGKSVLCLQWARHLARRGGRAVVLCYDLPPGALVARLLGLELREHTEARGDVAPDELEELMARLRDLDSGALHVSEAVASHPMLVAAEAALAEYGDRLVFLGGGLRRGEAADLATVLAAAGSAVPTTVFVDYLDRMPAARTPHDDAIELAVADLKDLALDRQVAVVAVATVEVPAFRSGLLGLHHLGRARMPAYEADLVLGMTDRGDRVRLQVLKHRTEAAGAVVDLAKDFDHHRLGPVVGRAPDPADP